MDVVLVATAFAGPVLVECRVMRFRATVRRGCRPAGNTDDLRHVRDLRSVLHCARGISDPPEGREGAEHPSAESNGQHPPRRGCTPPSVCVDVLDESREEGRPWFRTTLAENRLDLAIFRVPK